jgi:hypothetical protein
MELNISLNYLRPSTFIHLSHLSLGGPSSMVFEHLQNSFKLEVSFNDFP